MNDMLFRIAELERRMANMIRLGVIDQADYTKCRVRVKSGDLLTGWLPWLTRRAGNDVDWWAPEGGEQVVIFAPSGELVQGVVLPAIYQTVHPAPQASPDIHHILFKDGTFIQHDRAAKKLSINCQGQIVVDAAGSVDVTATGPVNVTTDAKATISAASTVEIDGAASGAVKGSVQGDCICAFTGAPHPHISASVKESA